MELIELIKEINQARTDPKAYSNKLIYQMSYVSTGDNKLILPTQEVIEIKEGLKAYHYGITHLKEYSPLHPVELNVPLSFICVNEAFKRAKEGPSIIKFNDHDKFKRYGTYECLGEIAFITEAGVGTVDYESIVVQLLVSDGDEMRRNRDVILNSNFNMIGVGKRMCDNNTKILIEIIFAKNWRITKEEGNDQAVHQLKTNQEDKELMLLKEIDKYEKTIKEKINNEYQYISLNEEKKIFKDNGKIKLIKQYHLVLDNNIRKNIIFSQSFFF